MTELTFEARRRLQEALAEALGPDEGWPRLRRVQAFLPLRFHDKLLGERILLVVGERGSGKSALFRFLLDCDRAALAHVFPRAPAQMQVLEGYSAGPGHPGPHDWFDWAEQATGLDLERAWFGHLIGRLAPIVAEIPLPPAVAEALSGWRDSVHELGRWLPAFHRVASQASTWLDQVERHLAGQGRTVFVVYDELDLISRSGQLQIAARVCAALAGAWITLSARLRQVQGRIFLRPDLAKLTLSGAADASKLRNQQAELRWTAEDVFRAVLRRLGSRAELRVWLEAEPAAVRFDRHPDIGWMPPRALPETLQLPFPVPVVAEASPPDCQEAFATRLLGRTMGVGPNKGYTHTWIRNHAADARGTVLPRVTFNLLRGAAELALQTPESIHGLHLIRADHLDAAQSQAGEQRLRELRESHPVVCRVEALRGLTFPLTHTEAVDRLSHPPSLPGVSAPVDDGYGEEGEAVLNALMGLGVLLPRPPVRRPLQAGELAATERRIDLPELFRKALGGKRKGGPLQLPR